MTNPSFCGIIHPVIENKMIVSKGGFDIMVADKQFFQCLKCGNVHREKMNFNIESDLYIKLVCPNCRDETMQLWVGDREEDKYIYYDLIIDERYYKYNTK